MRLLLMRHGPAALREEWLAEDAARPLTKDGKKKTRRAAAGLTRVVEHLDSIATSPLLRALQTADIVHDSFGEYEPELITWPELQNAPFEALCRRLQALPETEIADFTVMMVGHEPGLGRFASQLLTGSPDDLSLDFKKAAVCALELHFEGTVPVAQLLWFAPPKLLRALGERR